MTHIRIDEQSWLKEIIRNAIGHIIVNDKMIIKEGQERALSNRLCMYLLKDFSGWDVDCEYNRVGFGQEPKRTSSNDLRTTVRTVLNCQRQNAGFSLRV